MNDWNAPKYLKFFNLNSYLPPTPLEKTKKTHPTLSKAYLVLHVYVFTSKSGVLLFV